MNHFVDSVEAIDRAAFVLINNTLRHVLLDVFMPFITEKGNFVAPLALVVFYLLTKGGRQGRLIVLCAVPLIVCADASATALRSYFQRVRPCQALEGVRLLVGCSDSFSFPSGHATNAFALATFFATYYRQRAVLLFIIAAVVGYSRIYVGVHYPLDVLGGALLGVAFGLAFGVSSRRLGRRWLKKRVERHGREASRRSESTRPGALPPDPALRNLRTALPLSSQSGSMWSGGFDAEKASRGAVVRISLARGRIDPGWR